MSTTLQTAQHTVLQALLQHTAQGKVYEDGPEGVGMYGTTAHICTVFNTVLEHLGAEQVQGLAELDSADGTLDLSVDFVYEGHSMYLTTCYESQD